MTRVRGKIHIMSSPSKRKAPFYAKDHGIVLVVGLLFIMVLAAVGSIAYMTTANDLAISKNYHQTNEAFNVALAGVEEARERLRLDLSDENYIGDPTSGGGVDPWWSAYLMTSTDFTIDDDPNYNPNYENLYPTPSDHTNTSPVVNTLNAADSSMRYMVKIRHKREYDAELNGHTASTPHYVDLDEEAATNSSSAPGNVIYYGYGDPSNPSKLVQFTPKVGTEYRPVEIVTAIGGSDLSRSGIEVEVVNFPGPPIVAAIYSKGDATSHGTAPSVSGEDECGQAPDKPPIYTLDPSITNVSGHPDYTGDPPYPVQGPTDIDIQGYVDMLKGSANYIVGGDLDGKKMGGSNGNSNGNSSSSSSSSSSSGGDTSSSSSSSGGDTSSSSSSSSSSSGAGGTDTAGDGGSDKPPSGSWPTIGGPTDYVIAYSDHSMKANNVQGYGILLVDGDLTLSGNFSWNGIVIVTGQMRFNGGGRMDNISGAAMTASTVRINGGLQIDYNSCEVSRALGAANALSIIRWKDLSLG